MSSGLGKRAVVAVVAALLAVAVLLVTRVLAGGGEHEVVQVSLDSQVAVATATATSIGYPDSNAFGLLPVTTVAYPDFVKAVSAPGTRPVSWLSHNAGTGRVAVAVTDTGGRLRIISTLLPATTGQDKPVLSLAALGVPIRSVSTQDTATLLPAGLAAGQGAASGSGSGAAWASPAGPFATFVFPLLLIGLLLGGFLLLQRNRVGLAPARGTSAVEVPATRFADVAGASEAVEELREAVDILARRAHYAQKGVTLPRGALLMGPPGTGKTLLARAVAGEAGVPFYSMSGSDFMEMYVGVGASRIRGLFAKARKHEEGAIVFIDEIDTLGRARSGSAERSSGHHGEQESTLNALLVELDGFSEGSRVFVVGATNRPDLLDPALTRPGRLERQIHVGLADRPGREEILSTHVSKRGLSLHSSVSLSRVASRTPGMSGAELERVVNEASLTMVRAGREQVTSDDFDAAVALVVMGKPRLSALVTDRDRLITAWHEAGHATAGLVLADAEDPLSVSIIPRGPAGGITWFEGRDDQFLSRTQAHARLTVALAGRAAEELLLDGEFTSGPHGDLQSATNLAYAMVTRFGMVEAMLTSVGGDMTYVLATDATVREAVEDLLGDALGRARAVLAEHRALMLALVDDLLEHDTLNHEDLDAACTRTGTARACR